MECWLLTAQPDNLHRISGTVNTKAGKSIVGSALALKGCGWSNWGAPITLFVGRGIVKKGEDQPRTGEELICMF